MIKLFKKFALALASMSICFGICVSPIMVSAEEVPQTSIEEVIPETSVPEVETPEETEKPNEKVETTFDDFLAWAQEEANRYGYGEDFAGAIEAIKTAATQKQVTLSTIASASVAIITLAYIIIKDIREKRYKAALVKTVKEFDTKIDKNIKGTNALIDGGNAIIDTESENGKTAKETKEEVQSLKRSMTSFISAFLRFTDGVKLGDNKKTEVQTNLLSALKEISTSEGVANESDKK